MKDGTRKTSKLRKKLEKQQRKFTKKLRALEIKLRQLVEGQKKKDIRGKPKSPGKAKSKPKRKPGIARAKTRQARKVLVKSRKPAGQAKLKITARQVPKRATPVGKKKAPKSAPRRVLASTPAFLVPDVKPVADQTVPTPED